MSTGSKIARLLGAWPRTPGAGGARLPEYAALAAAVRGLLRDGRLGLSVRMPAERELAAALKVSRTTVTAAYRELRATGHLTSRRGAGSWTAVPEGQRIAASGFWAPVDEPDVLDLATAAMPAPVELAEAAQEALADLPAYARGAGYHPAGLPVLRAAVADLFVHRGLPTRPEQVLITNGVQHAVDLVLRLTVTPGQLVLAELPTYPNVITALRAHRTRLAAHRLDRVDGWDAADLLMTLRTTRPPLAYLIPEFQNPTGHLMPVNLRERLAATAHSAGTDLLIDESFVDLPLGTNATMPPPVAVFDRHARVLTVGGLTKPYWGGLRVGWIRASASVIARLSAVRVAMDMAGPVLDQLVAVHLLERAGDIVRERRAQLTRQRDALAAALTGQLPEWTFAVPPGGVCLWAELEAPISSALTAAAGHHGVRLAAGPHFGADATLERFLRVPFTLPVDDLQEAVHRLALARAGLDRAAPPQWSTSDLVA